MLMAPAVINMSPHFPNMESPSGPRGEPLLNSHEQGNLDTFLGFIYDNWTAHRPIHDSLADVEFPILEAVGSAHGTSGQTAVPIPSAGSTSLVDNFVFQVPNPLPPAMLNAQLPPQPQAHFTPPVTQDDTTVYGLQQQDDLTAANLIHSMGRQHSLGSFGDREATASARRAIPRGHLRHEAMDDFMSHSQGLRSDGASMFVEMHTGGSQELAMARTSLAHQFSFGTDQSFTAGPFQPAPHETMEALSNGLIGHMACLQPEGMADATSSSPRQNGDGSPTKRKAEFPSNGSSLEGFANAPKRRRKSRAQPNRDDNDNDADTSRAQGSNAPDASASPPVATSHRRRRSNAEPKAPRTNLTESQKRSNHIQSEKKRRNLIKEGYDDVSAIVPGVKGGGHSKSGALIVTFDFILSLIATKENLETKLKELETGSLQ
jgi:hypothetical protein